MQFRNSMLKNICIQKLVNIKIRSWIHQESQFYSHNDKYLRNEHSVNKSSLVIICIMQNVFYIEWNVAIEGR